ncbi:hypothetical protein D3C87_1881510 [compost metagenome]
MTAPVGFVGVAIGILSECSIVLDHLTRRCVRVEIVIEMDAVDIVVLRDVDGHVCNKLPYFGNAEIEQLITVIS